MTRRRPRKPKLTGFKLGKLTLDPGDYLVLKSPLPISQETAERLKQHFEKIFADLGVKTVVLGDGLDLLKLSPPPSKK